MSVHPSTGVLSVGSTGSHGCWRARCSRKAENTHQGGGAGKDGKPGFSSGVCEGKGNASHWPAGQINFHNVYLGLTFVEAAPQCDPWDIYPA